MNKLFFTVLIVMVISLVIVLVALGIKLFAPNLLNNISSKESRLQQSDTSDTSTLTLPFDINVNNPAIISSRLGYVVEGKITQIKNTTDGQEIVISPEVSGLPRFIIGPETIIMFADMSTTKQATAKDLATGQKIRVLAIYGLRTKLWNIFQITILSSIPVTPETGE